MQFRGRIVRYTLHRAAVDAGHISAFCEGVAEAEIANGDRATAGERVGYPDAPSLL